MLSQANGIETLESGYIHAVAELNFLKYMFLLITYDTYILNMGALVVCMAICVKSHQMTVLARSFG